MHIEEAIESCVHDGTLGMGDPLPTITSLAKHLKAARCTVAKAYVRLATKGILSTHGRKGTFVEMNRRKRSVETEKVLAGPAPFKFRKTAANAETPGFRKLCWFDIGSNILSTTELLDFELLHLRRKFENVLALKPAQGLHADADLNDALVNLLKKRNLCINPQQFCVGPCHSEFVQIALRSLINPGEVVVMSSAYDRTCYNLLLNCSAQIRCAPADKEGLNTDLLEQICRREHVKVVLVRPSADYPIPVAMTMARRKRLLELAKQYEFVIIEVDENYEFCYQNAQCPLIATTEINRVIYISTVCSALHYQFAWALIAGPESFIKNLKRITSNAVPKFSKAVERTMAEAINQDTITAHITKLYHQHSCTKRKIINMVELHLGTLVNYHPPDSGLYFWLDFLRPVSSRCLHDIFYKNNLGIPKEDRKGLPQTYNSLRIAFGNINLNNLDASLKQIAKLLKKSQ
nr:PLP-dependent aminotransferase family protein [Pedobacter xinjiangensis]